MVFERFFWSFRPCIEGFKYCRQLISIDDTYLHGLYDVKLLIVVAFDAHNLIFPLTLTIIDE